MPPLPEARGAGALVVLGENLHYFGGTGFDRIYGGWWKPVLRRDAQRVVESSAERYIQWLRGEVSMG
jgi:hypothetical protein